MSCGICTGTAALVTVVDGVDACPVCLKRPLADWVGPLQKRLPRIGVTLPDLPKGPSCWFCGKTAREARKLIVGSLAGICDECVALCGDIIAEEIDRDGRPT